MNDDRHSELRASEAAPSPEHRSPEHGSPERRDDRGRDERPGETRAAAGGASPRELHDRELRDGEGYGARSSAERRSDERRDRAEPASPGLRGAGVETGGEWAAPRDTGAPDGPTDWEHHDPAVRPHPGSTYASGPGPGTGSGSGAGSGAAAGTAGTAADRPRNPGTHETEREARQAAAPPQAPGLGHGAAAHGAASHGGGGHGAAGDAAPGAEDRPREGRGAVEARVTRHGEAALFSEEERRRLHARWDALQGSFIDDPRHAVTEADRLVRDTIGSLHDLFERDRVQLEAVWSRGEQVSTEDLRLTLQRYRSFFDRLLSV